MPTRFNTPVSPRGDAPLARMLRHIPPYVALILLAFITGLVTGTAAFILKTTVRWVSHPIASHLAAGHANWLLLVAPLIGIILAGLYQRHILHKFIWHGTDRLNRAIADRRYYLAPDLTYSPIIASTLTLGFGGSAGSEGPIAYTGAAIGSNIARFCGVSTETVRIMLACGASAGIAGIFKAPVGGVLFSLEVLSIALTPHAIIALFASSVTAALTAFLLDGCTTDLVFRNVSALSWQWLPWTPLLGVFCGLYSFYYASIMSRMKRWFGSFSEPMVKNLVSGAILSALVFLFPPLFGEGYDFMTRILAGEVSYFSAFSLFAADDSNLLTTILLAFAIIAVKAFAAASTNSGGGVAGDFAPTLMAGCVGGFFLASLLNLCGLHLPVADFAFIGMAGVMAGAVRAPFMAIFITVEMTQAYSLLLPVAVVAAISYLIVIFLRHIFRLPSSLPATF